jgi:hypothetical protein
VISDLTGNTAEMVPNRYDFDLATGHSDTGLRACTYDLDIIPGEEGDIVFVEPPEGGTNWRLVELRPVSESSGASFLLCPRCD